MLLRVFRRRARDYDSDEEFCETEFHNSDGTPDLKPSAYEVDEDLRVRATTEHVASFWGSPATVRAADIADLVGEASPERGTTEFQFTREVHREVRLPNRAALVSFAAALRADAHRYDLPDVPKADLRRYIRARLAEEDKEWVAWLGQAPGSRWRKLARLPSGSS